MKLSLNRARAQCSVVCILYRAWRLGRLADTRAKGARAFYCSIVLHTLIWGGERGLLCAAYKASFFTSTTTSYGIAALCGAYLNHACLLALVSAGKNFLSSSKVLLRRSCFHYSDTAALVLLLLVVCCKRSGDYTPSCTNTKGAFISYVLSFFTLSVVGLFRKQDKRRL